MSHDIINEVITIFGKELLCQLLDNIRKATWFAILADETTDITNCEQLSISICWVTENYVIHEDFIDLVHVPRITSSVVTEALKDILIQCSLPLAQCRGKAYDGAANMMGHIQGVATCYCCSLLCTLPEPLSAGCNKKCKLIRSALDIVLEICKLIKIT